MENVKTTVKNGKLVIEVDLSVEGKPSTSGKSLVIASTHGNAPVEGTEFVLGLNLYKKVKK